MIFRRKDKHYLITLIDDKKTETMQVNAKSGRLAKKIVSDLLIRCSLFPYKTKKDFKLKCKKIKL